ncbi:hypothetical protein [Halalkalibacter hemicellulosilyticus]|uniref:Uncharacterized protein n=1 Tax=Halalkalibacter hemicellulosilyticusJCM 9152 TaxID=1236971 RepID=W4QBA5_9BACI|nr:hypothetical protein [Halalkalibacter hemicellulosilyticus]GAE28928.1 hypothetical protein JCM9152_266 [Halalkalibacter hemicellulosilyticusJCM 9152]
MFEGPSVQYLPPTVISQYVNQWITTSIPTYGQVVAYITDFNRRTGMVSMFMYAPPRYQPQFIQVHNSDLIGVSPYYGPVPPRPGRPPGPWQPQPPRPPYPWGPGQPGTGGGFWPWMYYQLGSAIFR